VGPIQPPASIWRAVEDGLAAWVVRRVVLDLTAAPEWMAHRHSLPVRGVAGRRLAGGESGRQSPEWRSFVLRLAPGCGSRFPQGQDKTIKQQKRGVRIATTSDEVDTYLASERTCRVATVGPNGPHVAPLWFVWDGTFLWLNSMVNSQRWADLAREPNIAVVIDSGMEFWELRGVEITGKAESVGDVPRSTSPNGGLARPELLFAQKYGRTDSFIPDGRHAWLRITPSKVMSWDFRKNPGLWPDSRNPSLGDSS
jgi:Pyridoxamine 5'-phosphate oxidase